MTWQYTAEAAILFFTTCISIIIAWIAWHRRDMPGSIALCLVMVSIALWCFSAGLESAALDHGLKLILVKFETLGVVSTPLILLGFIVRYLHYDRWINFRNGCLVSILPLVGLILTFTNERHRLIWSGVSFPAQPPGAMLLERGPAYLPLVIYINAVVLVGLVLLIRRWFMETGANRSRITIILVGILIPLIASLLKNLGLIPIPGVDLVPVTLSFTGVIIAFGILRMKHINLLPVARENLVENLRDGVLVLDLRDHVVDINHAAQKMIGVPAAAVINLPASRLPEPWQTALCLSDEPFVENREITLQAGSPIHLEVQTTALVDREQRPSGRLIVLHDITERREAELQLALRVNELGMLNRVSLAITTGLDLATVLKTLHEQCNAIIPSQIFYVALYNEVTGLIEMPLYYEGAYSVPSPRDILHQPGLTGFIITTRKTLYIPDTVHPQGECPIPPIRLGGQPSRSYVGIPLILRDKVIGVMSVQSFEPLAFDQEQIRLLETVAVEAAIAIENARLYGEVQRLAIIDELTGIYNYRGLIELGRREVERAIRFDHPLALLFFDLDGFKMFNNTYSHTTGNIVLKEVAQRCQSVLRSVDVFTRYGGDEFVVLLPETDREMALQVAERLRAEVAATKVTTKFGDLGVTISIGLSMSAGETADIDTLIENANRAEHRAKLQGNCVVVDE